MEIPASKGFRALEYALPTIDWCLPQAVSQRIRDAINAADITGQQILPVADVREGTEDSVCLP